MSYMHIENLYKSTEILLFRECYALEKIHGTSAHIRYADDALKFFSGGASHEQFVKLFDHDGLLERFKLLGQTEVMIYGEAYGGKCQGMSKTYGPDLRFVAFEVKIGKSWLSVPQAADIVLSLCLDFVSWNKIRTDLEVLDAERDLPSVQCMKNGMGDHPREGIVLRPLIEVTMNNAERIIAKHKREDFQERTHQPKVTDADKLTVLSSAKEIADEWVTPMRLTHVLDSFPGASIEQTGEIIKAMISDIEREALGEIVSGRETRAAIGKKTGALFKERLHTRLLSWADGERD